MKTNSTTVTRGEEAPGKEKKEEKKHGRPFPSLIPFTFLPSTSTIPRTRVLVNFYDTCRETEKKKKKKYVRK